MRRRLGGRQAARFRTAVILAACLSVSQNAHALDCPVPPVQTQRDWDTQVNVEVAKIGWLRGAQLETRVRSATQNLMAKLPRADKVYLEQMMFAAYCSGLREDTSMAEAAKSRLILEYRRALLTALER
jgi:hypothetical protein